MNKQTERERIVVEIDQDVDENLRIRRAKNRKFQLSKIGRFFFSALARGDKRAEEFAKEAMTQDC